MGKCRFCGRDLEELRTCYVLRSGFRVCSDCYDLQKLLSVPEAPEPSSVYSGSFS